MIKYVFGYIVTELGFKTDIMPSSLLTGCQASSFSYHKTLGSYQCSWGHSLVSDYKIVSGDKVGQGEGLLVIWADPIERPETCQQDRSLKSCSNLYFSQYKIAKI